MNVKEVIQYIAEEDLEINLTLQVGSEANESLKEEVRQLRKRIDELQMNDNASLPEPEVSGEIEANEGEAPENIKEAFEEGTEVESNPVDEVPPEDEDTEIGGKAGEAMDAMKSEVNDDDADPEEDDDQFEEMFGDDESSEEQPTEPPEEEPTPEERSEAGADFEDLFGDV